MLRLSSDITGTLACVSSPLTRLSQTEVTKTSFIEEVNAERLHLLLYFILINSLRELSM